MLADRKLQLLRELVANATREELIWMNGFLNGLLDIELANNAAAAIPAQTNTLAGCTVVYGTESGNSKRVATDFSARLKKNGVQVKIKSLDQYRVADLEKESCLLVVMSTQGDGEPPAAAKKFYDYLQHNELSLAHLKFGVLALGDSSYPLFCKAGEDVDSRLQQLGAERIVPLRKCDTDFELDASEWIDELIGTALSAPISKQVAVEKVKPAKSGKKIYEAIVLSSVNLNDRGSNKETYHLEITTHEAISYEPGDAIGVIPKNNPPAVDKVLELLELEKEQMVMYKSNSYHAGYLFGEKINIQYLPERIVKEYAKLTGKEIPAIRMDLVDLLRIYPTDAAIGLEPLLNILDPIVPRLYSIASSPAAHGEHEVHLTVSRSKFTIDGHQRFGLCSDYLSSLKEGDELDVYIQKNNAFKLPEADADIIMVGPGTGIAPFRSFLFERDARGDQGRNWLFFGDQHFVTDFLYQTELQTFLETGVLTKFNTAFSRDQQEKLYVQHRMLQQSAELFAWIESGAHIYICGAKEPMSIDVEHTLVQIIAQQADISEEAAAEYIVALDGNGRYHKDVY